MEKDRKSIKDSSLVDEIRSRRLREDFTRED
jgi:hypothetical protein